MPESARVHDRVNAGVLRCIENVAGLDAELQTTHVTERKGSPQTLVCTKTQNSYERSRKQYQVDQVVLAELEKLEGASSRRIRKSF